MSHLNRVVAIVAATLSAAAYADNLPYMVQDIEGLPTPSSTARGFMPLGDRVVFRASTPEVGNGLWISDGTAAGTSLLRSGITLYPSGVEFGYLNGELYFGASDEPRVGAYDLWATDGTPAGTRLVREMPFTAATSTPVWFVEFGGRLYFSVFDGVASTSIWVTDGTEQGTTVFFAGRDAGALASIGGRLLFTEYEDATGSELWFGDGTPQGSSRLTDIFPGPHSGFIRRMTMMGDHFYFLGRDETHNVELWRTDGTAEGTNLVRDIVAGAGTAFPAVPPTPNFAVMGDALYFLARTPEYGSELWRSDGIETGTDIVIDFRPGSSDGAPSSPIRATHDRVFFRASPSGLSTSIAVTDGTTVGTTSIIPDLITGGGIQTTDDLAFVTGAFASGPQLWRSDGTPEGTYVLRTGSATEITAVGAQIAFVASDAQHGAEPWFSDGTVDGTRMVADIANVASGDPTFLTDVRGQLFYRSNDPDVGIEPFRTRGTAETTGVVADIVPGPGSSYATEFQTIEGGTIFRAVLTPGSSSLRVWRTGDDGNGAVLVVSAPAMSRLSPISLNGFVYCLAELGGLWRTDGLNSFSVASNSFYALGTLGSQLLLGGTSAGTGDALWVGDGTSAGAAIDMPAGPSDYGAPEWIGTRGTRAYYGLSQSPGPRIYSTDGTFVGTRGVPGTENMGLTDEPAVQFHGSLYVPAIVNNTLSLIALDGPDATPRVILGGNVFALAVLDDRLFIAATAIGTGRGLWVSDGTAEGTVQIPGVQPESIGSVNIVGMDDAVYFPARDEAHGVELWRSRGTAESTQMVADLNPGPASSNPGWLTASGDRLYFAANDGVHGTELWALARDVPGDIDGDGDTDLQDLSYLLANFGGAGPIGDLDADGDVDLQDLNYLLSNFGDSIGP